MLKAQIEAVKSESEKDLREAKEKHRQEAQELALENQALLAKAEDRRDRDLIRQIRRELDEHKRRCTELLGEVSDLRKERDLLKLDKGDSQVKHARDLEEARNQIRSLTSEVERCQFKTSQAEDERQKIMLKLEKRSTEVAQVMTESANMQAILREKDLTLDQLRKQVDTLKAELAASELAR